MSNGSPAVACGPGNHEWGRWTRGRTEWRRIREDCGRDQREERSERVLSARSPGAASEPVEDLQIANVAPGVVAEDPPPDALAPGRGHPTSSIRNAMDANPGRWYRWGERLRSGPSIVTQLRKQGYEATYKKFDSAFTVWARRPPVSSVRKCNDPVTAPMPRLWRTEHRK
jgi:hypothetical protein